MHTHTHTHTHTHKHARKHAHTHTHTNTRVIRTDTYVHVSVRAGPAAASGGYVAEPAARSKAGPPARSGDDARTCRALIRLALLQTTALYADGLGTHSCVCVWLHIISRMYETANKSYGFHACFIPDNIGCLMPVVSYFHTCFIPVSIPVSDMFHSVQPLAAFLHLNLFIRPICKVRIRENWPSACARACLHQAARRAT